MKAVMMLGCGQVGTCAARSIAQRNIPVVGCDKSGDWEFFATYGPEKPSTCEAADVLDEGHIRSLLRKYRIDAVVLAAGLTGTPAANQNWRSSTEGAAAVAKAMSKECVRRLIFISSFAVYGIPAGPSILESTPLRPTSNYGRSKVAAEVVLEEFRGQGLDVRILRPCGVYGPYPIDRGSKSARLIQRLLVSAAVEGEVNLTAPAEALDEFIYSKDLGEAVALATLTDRRAGSHTFNVGAGTRATAHDLVEAIQEAVPGSRVKIELTAGRSERLMPPLNIDRLRAELGFQPRFNLSQGFKSYLQEFWKSPGSLMQTAVNTLVEPQSDSALL